MSGQQKKTGFCQYGYSNENTEVSYSKEVRKSLFPYLCVHREKPKA